jgi:hydrogenase-4 component F
VTGIGATLPVTAALFVAGFFAISGAPPFGTFIGEIALVSGAVGSGRIGLALVILALQAAIFVAIGRSVFAMVFAPAAGDATGAAVRAPESRWLTLPPLALLALAAWLGLALPGSLREALAAAARSIGGSAP